MADASAVTRNPWSWVPSLYFAQGIPYVMVMTVSVIMYKRLGISNTDIAFYTSWLYLPWVIKPLWSPVVDLLGTKRMWIVVMQGISGVLLAMVALTIPAPRFFQYTIAIFWLMAFGSATHDIAADGFYMLGLKQYQQAAFVGVRSTFYRIATIAAQGLLVMLAGYIESASGLLPVTITAAVVPDAANSPIEFRPATAPSPSTDGMELIAGATQVSISTIKREGEDPDTLIARAREQNIANQFCEAPSGGSAVKKEGPSWWARHVSTPLGTFLRARFGDTRRAEPAGTGNIGVTTLRLSQRPPPGKNVVVSLSRVKGEERIEIAEGARLVFNEHNWDKPALVVFRVNPKIRGEAQASFTATSGNIPLAWTTVAGVLAVLFMAFCIYHKLVLPRPGNDGPADSSGAGTFIGEFLRSFVLFCQGKSLSVVVGFLLFFRFAEAQLVKLVSPFLLDPRDVGGLGLSTGQVGLVYGTFGIAALTVGGLLGGYVVARRGLRFWLWPMVLIMHLPDLAFVYLSYRQPQSIGVISAAVALEQFGYGFGFTAYMLFMIMVAEGKHKTAHYAICTGFMALGMMVPGMYSGWLQEHVGYRWFFIWVAVSTLPGFLVAALVRIDPGFGQRKLGAA